MGKRIISQRRGRGTSTYRAPSHRYKTKCSYPRLEDKQLTGKIINMTHDPGKSAPTVTIKFENGKIITLPSSINLRVNQEVSLGNNVKTGNIVKLSDIPIGVDIFAIEKLPGSGPCFCKASGTSARIVSRTKDKVTIQFPSKTQAELHKECRATIGIVAGSGRKEKPFVKAGKRHHAMRAKGKLYPLTSGVAMNAVDHPFGSGRGRHMGKPRNAPRDAPPGRKVGLIKARRTGKRK